MSPEPRPDHQDRSDATLAALAKDVPRVFGAWLASLTGAKRQEAQERLTRGQAWLAKNEQQKDGAR